MSADSYTGDHIPASTKEWVDWIALQESRTLRVYQEDPHRLIADFRRERQISRGYQGREILELLQNANDAAVAAGTVGKVHIELRPEGLIVANTGEQFTIDGINSLRITDLSPKLRQKNRLIGQKGLGFRSVLNWSRQPYITSGYLRLAYADSKLQALCAWLEAANPLIASLIAAERKHGHEIILPSLPFPLPIVDGQTGSLEFTPQYVSIVDRCDDLRERYDTVIGMPFRDASVFPFAQRELRELRPEILLFARGLGFMTISSEQGKEEQWSIKGVDVRTLTIKGTTSVEHKFRVFVSHGRIPEELSNESTSGEYEIVIAVPEADVPRQPQSLFSFFPTNIRFPFPVICHATLELDSNRKYPTDGQPNEFIFGEVAEHLASVAESIKLDSDPWHQASNVARQSDYDTSLERAGFGSRLRKSLKGKRIVPLVHGGHAESAHCVRLDAKELSWLPKNGFTNVVLPVSDRYIRGLLDELGVPTLGSDEFRDRLNAVEFASMADRVATITGLLTENLTPRDPAPNLLVDKAGQVIPSGERIYFAQEKDQKEYARPPWLKLHFIDEGCRNALTESLKIKERRDLRLKLDPYGVQEYSLASVATAIAVETRKQMENDKDNEIQYQQDMLVALFDLFPEVGEAPRLPDTTGVPLPALDKSFQDSRQLYLSEGYGDNGKLLASLYAACPERLVANPEVLGLDGLSNHTISFLKWMGVSVWPREILTDAVEDEFLAYVLDNVTYPMNNRHHIRAQRADFYRPFVKQIRTLDSLEKILRANPAALITWLALDSRANEWGRMNVGQGELWDYPQYSRTYFQFTTAIPSYIRWKVMSTAWVAIADDQKAEPKRCMMGERGLEKLLPQPLDFRHPLFERYGITSRLKRVALENAGVTPDLSHLEPEQIYELITLMPKVDPHGKHARTLCRTLLERIDMDMRIWPDVPESFIASAQMWGKGPEGEKYYPVKQLVHADSEDFPELLCQRLRIVDLPKRVGPVKVRRLFGIEPIDRKKIVQRILRHVDLPEARDIQAQFQRAKPYLYYLRNIRSQQSSDLAQMQALEICLCSTIDVSVEYEDLKIPASIGHHLQWILDDGRAYILFADETRPSLESDLLADTIGVIVASIFNLAQGGDFARLVRCSESDRLPLLRRIVGDTNIPEFIEISAQFDRALRGFSFDLPSEQIPSSSTADASTSIEGLEEAESQDPMTVTDSGEGDITSTQKEHEPTAPPKKLRVVVRAPGRKLPGGHRKGLTRVVDGEVCEKRAQQFEELQSRFTLRASNVTGYQGPRCDLLSFASEADRAAFQAQPRNFERDLSFVARFIEVKGRSHENSPISLKGNELDAAKIYGDRYYLYRLYMEGADKYVLLVLQDPLSHPEAVEDIKDIYMSRADVERFDLEVEHSESDHK